MKKISPVLQHDFKDCGICCMQWIIMYYDGYISLEKLRIDTLTNINGTNAYEIVNTFKKWGFDAMGLKDVNIAKDILKFPLIAHLQLENGLEHFVVIKAVDANIIYLMDPGIGNRKLKLDEFNKLFTGHVIICNPRSNIIKMDKTNNLTDLFWQIIKKEKFLIIKIIITSFLLTIISLICNYYLKVSSNLLNTNNHYLKILFIIFGIFTIIKVFFKYIRSYCLNYLNNAVDLSIYPNFLHHIFYLPFKSIKSRSTGEIMTRINDLSNIKNLFSEIFVSCFLDTIMMISSTFILYTINKNLFLIVILFIFIYIIYGLLVSKIVYKNILKNIDYQTDFNAITLENIDSLISLKNLNVLDNGLFQIEKSLSRYFLHSFKFNNLFNILEFFKNLILDLSFFLVNTYGIWYAYKGSLTIINLFTFNLILGYFIEPIENFINLLPKYNFIKASFNKISDFLNIEEENLQDESRVLLGNITFSSVAYSYNNYDYLFKDLSFEIKKGMHVLLNGPSGSGKSTICKIIHKDLAVNNGKVLIDGCNINDLNLRTIRDNILYVSQKEELLTLTIKENIIMNRNISDEEFLKICDICEIEDIVKKKSLRYDSLIENSTMNLSGGERQRIILARGLLKKASIIILDEALSEVDKKLEGKIIKNIRKYFKDKTIIYISHKNQTKTFENIINIGDES